MHNINKMRLLAGLPINLEYEIQHPDINRQPKQQLKESRKLPRSKQELSSKSLTNMTARVNHLKSAIQLLHNALTELESIPAVDYISVVPDFIEDLEMLINGDHGSTTLDSLLDDFEEDLRTFERARDSRKQHKERLRQEKEEEEDLDIPSEECEMLNFDLSESLRESATDTEWMNQVKEAIRQSGVDPEDPDAELLVVSDIDFTNVYEAEDYPDKPIHLFGNLYRLGDTKTFIARVNQPPTDMAESELTEMHTQTSMMLRAMGIDPEEYQRKEKKRREAAKAAKAAKKGKGMGIGKMIKRKLQMESVDYDVAANAVSHEVKDDPVNVAKDQDDLYYAKTEDDKEESPNQLAKNLYNDSQKIKVPSKILSDLKEQIDEARRTAKTFERRRDFDSVNFHNDLANAFEEILTKLSEGTLYSLKEAQIFMTSLMGPMLHKIPSDVVKFIASGGVTRSLKHYMIDVSKDYPVTGKPFKNPGEKQ